MGSLKPPDPFDPIEHADSAVKAFDLYVRQWKLWYRAECMGHIKDDASDATKKLHMANFFRASIARSPRLLEDITHEFGGDESEFEKATFEGMTSKLRERYKPTQNQVLLHFQFHSLTQETDETIDTFINRVKEHAARCNFKCDSGTCDVMQTLIRDRIIMGTNNKSIRDDALEKEHKLSELEKQARKIEATVTAAHQISSTPPTTGVSCLTIDNTPKPDHNSIHAHPTADINFVRRQPRRNPQGTTPNRRRYDPTANEGQRANCLGCGHNNCNRNANCPARGQICDACGIRGHFKRCCLKTRKQQSSTAANAVNTIAYQYMPPQDPNHMQPAALTQPPSLPDPAYPQNSRVYATTSTKTRSNVTSKHAVLEINNHIITAMIDSGAEVNIILKDSVPENVTITPTAIMLTPYGSKPIKPLGQFLADTTWGKQRVPTTWIVLDNDYLQGKAENILSCHTAEQLEILKIQQTPIYSVQSLIKPDDNKSTDQILEQFSPVFHGLGKLQAAPVKLYLKAEFKPVIQPPRPIPYHLQEPFEKCIQAMLKDGVIEEHTGPVTWISNPVLVPKPDGSLRITVDLRQVNKAIENTHLPIPRVEDILPMFAGKQIFTKLDLRTAYHQLELSAESRPLTVFRAGDKLMRYKRLTMGSLPASGELNSRLRPMLANIADAEIIHDDIVIASETRETHNKTLSQVLQVLCDAGLTLNKTKCIIASDSIPFWGLIITKEGRKPDPEKCAALQQASPPSSKDELISFLCMVRANADFIPDLAAMTANLRNLTKKHAKFHWTDLHSQEFNNIKQAFNQSVLLRHYDATKSTFLFVDAHITGLSAILAQGSSVDKAKAIALASRATSPTEAKYAQLELEALAIDFGLRRFHHYLVGGPITTVITDHQPLEAIWKSERKTSLRLERIQIRHQHINYVVKWHKGSENPADYLSRHAIPLQQLPSRIVEEAKIYEKLIYTLHTTHIQRPSHHSKSLKHNYRINCSCA
eukprot:Seg2314.7 transcript_id=Seg2314.7/GoldUCD/mRNA.D3Y31 product="Transposon Tf2-3 polyprotein" pseudo=true protein_id=Seg2314.7/GoldUCD/D3Y31